MITQGYCRTMARYNAWQNRSIYTAAAGLTPEAREMDRGAFFGSIRATLSHLMWADTTWMSRLDGGPGPEAGFSQTAQAYGWVDLVAERPQLDARITAWAEQVSDATLAGELTWYSGMVGREMRKDFALCVMQIFNHQTHHRGQVHAMLTAAGAEPEATDLPFIPEQDAVWPLA